jgi:hypothetical protein
MIAVGAAFSQQVSDRAKILQQCIDLPALQSYFPQNNLGAFLPVYVVQHGVLFEGNMAISKFGKNVIFQNKEEIMNNQICAFFLFNKFEINQNTATVSYSFYYSWHNYSTSPFDSPCIKVQGELILDIAGNWFFTESNTEGGNL